MRRLAGIVEAHHVVGKRDVALPGQVDTEGGNRVGGLIFEAAPFPVAMRNQNGGRRQFLAERPVQVAAKEIPGQAFQ